jgi:spermidine synthase
MTDRETAASGSPGAERNPDSLLIPTLLFGLYLMAASSGGVLLLAGWRVFSLTAGETSAARLAAVAAIALGAVIGGTLSGLRAPLVTRPGTRLALLQAGLGLAVAASWGLFRLSRSGYLLFWPVLGGTELGIWCARFVLAVALFLPSASLFVAMLPMVARLIVAGRQGLGIACGFAFGLTLAGLALGAAGGGVILLPELGTRGALLIAVALSGIAASGTVLVIQRGLEGPGALGANLSAGELPAGEPEGEEVLLDEETIAGATLAASNMLVGFCIWTYFIAWSRALGLLIGGMAPVRAVVVATFLAGLALGSFLAAALVERIGRLMASLAALLAGAAIVSALSMHLMTPAASLYLRLTPLLANPALAPMPAILTAAALMLPGCLLLGGALPLLPLAARERGRPMAATLPFLAFGAVLSDLLVGLLVVPGPGVRWTVSLAGAVCLLAAILFLGAIPFERPALRTTLGIALLGLMVVLGGFPATWDARIVASGLYRYGARTLERFGTIDQYLAMRRGLQPVLYREGRNATVYVERSLRSAPAGGRPIETLALSVDGRVAATTGEDLHAQILQAHVPILIHGPTHKALLIGFLNGVTAGSILRHPVNSLTILEREPALFETSEDFAAYNQRPLADSRVRRITDSPRAHLLADPTVYDVIIVGGIDPWLPQSDDLLTEEGFQILKGRLAQDGLLAQRVSLSTAPEGAIRTILRTFQRSFESVLVFQISQEDLLLLGSSRPLALDVGWIRNALDSSTSVAQDLARVLPLGVNGILLEFRCGGDGLKTVGGSGASNDDDRAFVEVAAARRMGVHDNSALLREIDAAWAGITPFLKNDGAVPKEQAEFLYNLAKAYLGVMSDPVRARGLAHELEALGHPILAHWVTGECLFQQHDLDGALGEWHSILETEPGNLDALFSLGNHYLDSGDYAAAEPYLARASRLNPSAAVVLYTHGRNLYLLERYKDAIEELNKVRSTPNGAKDYPIAQYMIGVSWHRLGQEADAASWLEAYLKWAYGQSSLTRLEVDAHLKLSEVYQKQGKPLLALKEKQKGDALLRNIEDYARKAGAATPPAPAPVPAPRND